ncbi:TonB-dependent receptor [Sphingopyxis lindanitolerans]|nr:TonB-dependent receptor [Sphingopyxis lindanitolerans]
MARDSIHGRIAARALLGVSLFTVTSAAHAQETATQTAKAADVTADDSGDIIVTAQRRQERLTDVPISITAITGDQIAAAGISNSNDIGLITPGLYIPQTGQNVQPTIRGIGTTISAVGADANVALYIDGVYQSAQTSNSFALPDLDRIEVLKGPQGTLFGRNATGGAIVIHTREPSFTPTGSLSLSYGSFNEFMARGYVSGPITDKLAASLSFVSTHDRGYTWNATRNEWNSETDEDTIRWRILWEPTSELKVILTGQYSDRASNLAQSIKPLDGNVNVRGTHPDLYLPTDPKIIVINEAPVAKVESKGGSLDVEWNTGGGTLTSTTAYSKDVPYQIFDTDYTSLSNSVQEFTTPSETFTQEFTYASDLSGPINFVVGGFYFDNKAQLIRWSRRQLDGPLTAFLDARTKTTSLAAFGELYVDLTDRLRVIGGIRYTNEKKSIDATGILDGPDTLVTDDKWNSFTPRASILYEITPSTNVYATFSQGFKAGAYNPSFIAGVPVQTDSVDPEKVTAYEIGLKHSDPKLRFGLSAFYYDYSDIQVQILTSIGGVNTTVIQNAADATVYGGDAELSYRVSDVFSLQAGLAYTHGRYDNFEDAVLTEPLPNGGNRQFVGDASGNKMIRTAPFTTNIGFNFNHPVNDDLSVEVNSVASYNSGFYMDPGNRVKQNAFTLINMSASLVFGDGGYKLGVWARNLLDEGYNIYAAQSTTGDNIAYGRPRSIGVQASARF